MNAMDVARFVAGFLFVGVGLFVLVASRGERGFGQRRQLGLILFAGGGLLLAVSFGLVDF